MKETKRILNYFLQQSIIKEQLQGTKTRMEFATDKQYRYWRNSEVMEIYRNLLEKGRKAIYDWKSSEEFLNKIRNGSDEEIEKLGKQYLNAYKKTGKRIREIITEEAEKRNYETEALEQEIVNTCPRCQGTGTLTHYSHIDNGRCWSCNGTGQVRF